MTDQTDAQVLAALEVLGWPDDRERSAHIDEDGHEVTPARHYWDLVTGVLTAAEAARFPLVSLLPEGMTEAELIERFRAALEQPQRITVLPPSESDREQAAFTRGVTEGRRQATEGWEREWGLSLHGHPAQCVLNEHAARGIAAEAPDDMQAKVVSRLVGPWEPAEQAESPDSPAAKMRSLRAHPHGSACICDDCTSRDEAEAAHMAAMEDRHQHDAEQDGDDRG